MACFRTVQTATGHITLVQEERFVLERDDGAKQLFLLAHNLAYDPEDLRALERAERHVTVEYEPIEDAIAGLAHSLTPDGSEP